MIDLASLTASLKRSDLAPIRQAARTLLTKPGSRPNLRLPVEAAQLAIYQEIVAIANCGIDPLNISARSFLSRLFLGFFQGDGQAAIDFSRYLAGKYLAGPDSGASLLFWRTGAGPLEELTRALSPEAQKPLVKGLRLNNEILMDRNSHPAIIELLFQIGALDRPKIVFVDNGYVGSLARRTIELLQNEQLLNYVEEERGITLPRHEWTFAAEMLCLTRSVGNPPCPIEGFNFVIGQPRSAGLNELAYLLDEGISFKEEKSGMKESVERRLFIEALIEAAGPVPL